jgi:hypothetical protein
MHGVCGCRLLTLYADVMRGTRDVRSRGCAVPVGGSTGGRLRRSEATS